MKEQVLDNMDIERERGITIKAQTVRLNYRAQERRGLHPEPHRHARPCRLRLRGVALARAPARARCWSSTPRQGVEAQTLANVYQAIDNNHEIVVVLNKIDLPAAEPERIKRAGRGGDRPRRLPGRADLGQDRPRHPRRAGGHRPPASAAARGRRDGAAEGHAGRQLVRRLSRRHRSGARHRRRA